MIIAGNASSFVQTLSRTLTERMRSTKQNKVGVSYLPLESGRLVEELES